MVSRSRCELQSRITMSDGAPKTPSSHAIAGGIITVALMEFLVEKGVLSNDEVRGILETAHRRIVPIAGSNNNAQIAAQIVSDLLTRRFPK